MAKRAPPARAALIHSHGGERPAVALGARAADEHGAVAHFGAFPTAIAMRRLVPSLACMLLFLPVLAHAWGPAGHRLVAELAQGQLEPGTAAQIRQLIGSHSLADVATWADDLRDDESQRALGRATAPLHYINFGSAACRYDATRDCPDGRCVVGGIERYAGVLGDRARSRAERAEALRFVVHLVADAHQPLHAGYRADRGGNRFQVQFNGRGSNLHAVWDTPVLASRKLGWPRHARELARKPLPAASGTPAQWVEESCRMTRDDGIYPSVHRVDQRYLARMRPLAERRVRSAAARLAAVLDRALEQR
jgi:hypothetical protein